MVLPARIETTSVSGPASRGQLRRRRVERLRLDGEHQNLRRRRRRVQREARARWRASTMSAAGSGSMTLIAPGARPRAEPGAQHRAAHLAGPGENQRGGEACMSSAFARSGLSRSGLAHIGPFLSQAWPLVSSITVWIASRPFLPAQTTN